MIQLQIDSKLDISLDGKILENTGQAVIDQYRPDQSSELGIILTHDEKIRELNRDYRNLDEVTDVLSFPSMEIDPDTKKLYLGDVIIAVPRANEQANKAGHPLLAELQLLVVHGILHLIGYDHDNEEQKTQMWEIQKNILEELGLSKIKIVTDQE